MAWLTEHMKYLAIALGLLAGLPLIWRRRRELALPKPWQTPLLALGFSVASVIGAMLFAAFEGLISGEGFHLGAISTYGVYFITPLFLALPLRCMGRDLRTIFDVFALYALPSLFLLRINCLVKGCCGGRAIGATGLQWPTRQAEMIFYAVMLLVLLRREKAAVPKGTAFPLLTAAYGIFRFAEEWFRTGAGNHLLHLAHGWSILAAILGLGIYFELNGVRGPAKRARGERSVSKC